MLRGGLEDEPSRVAKRHDVSANERIIATVSITAPTPAAPVSSRAMREACAMRS